MLESFHLFLFTAVAVLFIFQSILLFVRSANNKVRKTMAIVELLWGLAYLSVVVVMHVVNLADEYTLLREKVLVMGNFFIAFVLFFPMQVLLPGWLNAKRIFLLILPILLMTLIYYGGMRLLGETPAHLHTYAELADNLSQFNVWFRFVMCLSNVVYLVAILRWICGYEKKYEQWKNDNYADQEYVDISWMKYYKLIMEGIFLFYVGILFIGGRIPVFFHVIFVIISFSYLFYKALFFDSPYPADFYATLDTANRPKPCSPKFGISAVLKDLPVEKNAKDKGALDLLNEEEMESKFEGKISEYVVTVKHWIEHDQPYLYHDFKLTDVSRVLPLNRSYLSRVFNEGMGRNFSEVVRSYRVDYAKVLLLETPEIPMQEVAEVSGFSSTSSFMRSFKQETGLTPKQFRQKQEVEE